MRDKLSDEAGRLAALTRYAILDTSAEAPFDKITALVRTVLDVPIAAVTLVDRDRQWLKSCAGLSVQEIPRQISFCTHTIQKREATIIPDATQHPIFAVNPLVTDAPYIRSYLGIPLSTPDGYNLGALCALDVKPRDFNPLQVQIMTNFAALVMDEMELRLIAETDFLTGALTRRAFVTELEAAWRSARESDRAACVLLYDIDHFKHVNDRLGHEAGDHVLSGVAAAVAEAMPEGALFGRLGGEEFGVLLPGYDEAQARATAERLRTAIAGCRFPALPGVAVSASFGIAEAHELISSAAAWLACADAAMYRAKRNGRNCCAVARG